MNALPPALPKLTVLIALMALIGSAHAAERGLIADENGCRFVNPNPKAGETIAWTGACRDGWGEGPGTLQWTIDGTPGAHFVGTLAHGQPSGQGSERFSNGNRYEGPYVDGQPDGHGVYTWTNGDRYEGRFSGGRRPGPGVFTTITGLRYEGRFEQDDMNGRGVVSMAGGTRLEGTFRLGVLDEPGVLFVTQPSGERRLQVDTTEPLLPDVPAVSASAPGAPHADIGARCGPSYPPVALRQHASGFTKIALLVDPSGQVRRIRMIHPSGSDLAHQSLDLAALVAAVNCPIVPGTVGGRPASRWLPLRFEWRLE